MAEPVTELDLVVGSMLTWTPEEDRDAYEEEREWLQEVQDLLRDEGVEVDLLSQPGTQVWEGGIARFYDVYQLRRLAAHLERGDTIEGLLSDDGDSEEDVDDLLADIWEDETKTRFPHLIKHGIEDGYYLPVEFAEPIWFDYGEEEEGNGEFAEEDTTVSFGSSYGLLRELTDVDELLQQAGVPADNGARRAGGVLKVAAQQSINNGLPIIFW